MSSHWVSTAFGDLAHLEKGISYESSELCEENKGLPFINLKSIDRGGGYRPDGLKWYSGKFKNSQIVEPGDLILCCTDLTKQKAILGYPILVPDIGHSKFCISLDLAKIVVDESRILKSFLFLLLQDRKMREFMQSRSSGTTVMHLKTSEVPSVELELPPMVEQKRIVDLISAVDSYIQDLETQLDRAKLTRNAVLNNLLSAALDEWPVVTLGEVADVIGGGTPKTSKSEYWGGDVIWLTPTEITTQDGKVISNSIRKITEAGLKNSGAKVLPKGSVILTSRASVGFVAIAGIDLCTNQGFQSLVPKESLIAEFLMFWIQQNRVEFESRAAGSTFKEISPTNVRGIKMNLPPLKEQKRIVELITTLDDMVSSLESAIKQTRLLRTGLLHDLISGKHEIPSSYDKVLGAA